MDSSNATSVVPVAESTRADALASANLSLLVPGLAQATQRRWVPALVHLGAVLSYLLVVLQQGWGRAGWLAVAWNLWSAIEAYWHERRHPSRPQPNEEL
jgi:hypothetical protein